jgi:integrase/recombinase XerD
MTLDALGLKLADSLESWLAAFSTETRKCYRRDVLAFAGYLECQGIAFDAVSNEVVARYRDSLTGFSSATVARRISAISSFYAHRAETDLLLPNPARAVARPTIPTALQTRALTNTEARALFTQTVGGPSIDHALVCLILLNGLRVVDVCSARVADFDSQRKTLAVERRRVMESVSLTEQTVTALAAHLNERDWKPKALDPLLSDNGVGVSRARASSIIRRLGRAAGISRAVQPLMLRTTFLSVALATGVDLRAVQVAAGHADPASTLRHTLTPSEGSRAAETVATVLGSP